MQFVVKRDILLKSLNFVQGVVEKKNTLPILSNVLLQLKDKKLFYSGHIPKLVFRKDGRLLYQSRAPIPTTKDKKFVKSWRQVCIYSFPYKSLKKFSSIKKKTLLESIEDLESNRFIELGYKVKMLKMSDRSIAVDTMADLNKVRKKIDFMKIDVDGYEINVLRRYKKQRKLCPG